MPKPSDIILLNVVGTNGVTRKTKPVQRRFNGIGEQIDDAGKPVPGTPGLSGLPGEGGASTAPVFPQEQYSKALAKGLSGAQEAKDILFAHSQQVVQWEKSGGGGSEEMGIVNAALNYCYTVEGFLPQDGDGFVLKRENLNITKQPLTEGRQLWTVQGTAIYGA